MLLIDPPNAPGYGRLWSHLASDESFDELHAFARRLAIPARGFDRDHYDVPADRYDMVVAAGAVPVSSRELIARLTRAGLRRRKTTVLAPRKPGRTLVRARRLVPGDAVAVVAPSGPVDVARFEAGLAVLESWGLRVRELPGARGRHHAFEYLAADDAERAADFMKAWHDDEVAAVFAARGGYGAQRMVDLLDWDSLRDAGPKVLVGFSDVTALHQAFASRLGASTVHGPVVASLGSGDDEAREHLRRLLFEPEAALSLTPEPATTLVPGRAEGVLVGGNLAMLAAGVGAADQQPAAGGIVVLEDVGEDLYRLDRLLTQLLRSGWFEEVRGIALGQFTDCGPAELVVRLVEDRLAPLGVPMVADLPVGHVDRNLAFPLGLPAVLDADAGTLTLRQPALR